MEKIILLLVAVLGLIIAFKTKGIFHRIISLGIVISVLLVWTNNKNIILGSLLLIILLGLLTLIYGFREKNLSKLQRLGISLMGLFIIFGIIFKIMHFPYANEMRLILILPISIYLISLLQKKKQFYKEQSFMFFWITIAVLDLFRIVKLWL